MDPVLARRRAETARVGRLATVTPDCRPHVVPCCFAVCGDTVYTAIDAKKKSTLALRRLENIRAHPVASLLVDHYTDEWWALWWVRIDGRARVVDTTPEADDARNSLRAKYAQYEQVTMPGPVIALDITAWVAWP
ncbi:MAG: TIGR03668 family PPOX class F420-dependent oxidoreductase [Acidimicrobiaceae bacterium]|nr:TIGR03668 family PPOX class F420-dependent oxidoreductase [Acidimicrobiaceae bacterium]